MPDPVQISDLHLQSPISIRGAGGGGRGGGSNLSRRCAMDSFTPYISDLPSPISHLTPAAASCDLQSSISISNLRPSGGCPARGYTICILHLQSPPLTWQRPTRSTICDLNLASSTKPDCVVESATGSTPGLRSTVCDLLLPRRDLDYSASQVGTPSDEAGRRPRWPARGSGTPSRLQGFFVCLSHMRERREKQTQVCRTIGSMYHITRWSKTARPESTAVGA